MARLLIADRSLIYAQILAGYFEKDMQVHICTDGQEALEALEQLRPDAMYLDLQLPRKDGFAVLREAAYIPPVILANANYLAPYIQQTAAQLGIGHLMTMPAIGAAVSNLRTLMARTVTVTDPAAHKTILLLQQLGFQPNLDGYQQLCIGLPMYKPRLSLSKELYPAVAAALGHTDARNVEHSIRNAIKTAWLGRDPALWERYFPGGQCPTNQSFLARMAQEL